MQVWDPSWGWDNQIYYLSASRYNEVSNQFFLRPNTLMQGKKICLESKNNYKICAGNFSKNLYFGSLSYDQGNEGFSEDQSVVVYNKKFEMLTEFRPSEKINNPSENFTSKKIDNNKFIFAFRDPAIMPNGNIAVCTGGWRWGTFGNICELSYQNNELRIVNESILDNNLKSFSEIERCSFWNEFMFFSIRGALVSLNESNEIQVAKLNKNGLYSYYGTVKNSSNIYGGCVNKELKFLFWYPYSFTINNPSEQNLFFENSNWILKEKPRFNHFVKRNLSRKKLNITKKFIRKFKKIFY